MCDGLMKAKVQLCELDLSDNAFGPAGPDAIKHFLKSPCVYTLETLKLNNDGLGIFGGRVLLDLWVFLTNLMSPKDENFRDHLRLPHFESR